MSELTYAYHPTYTFVIASCKGVNPEVIRLDTDKDYKLARTNLNNQGGTNFIRIRHMGLNRMELEY